jgi:CDP-6-deoxy-D-xylo-4-hexulose-3-dehydrase
MRSMIGPETRALFIPSILGGLPDWDAIRAAADEHGLVVVEDSADTLGATLRGSSTGTRSDLSTTSFYGSHVINCAGNGGMLCVRDEAMYRRGKLLRSWGRSSSVFVESEAIENRFSVALDGIPYDAKFLFEEIGYNFEPSEMGAAFGLVQLRRLEENVAARRRNFDAQVAFFREWEEWLVLPRELPGTRSGWLAFPLTVRDEAPFTRRELQIHFEKNNIQTRTVFTGNVLRQPAFRGIDCRTDPQGYPCADAVTRGGIIFACHHGLAPSQIDHIHATFRRFVARYA